MRGDGRGDGAQRAPDRGWHVIDALRRLVIATALVALVLLLAEIGGCL